MFGIRRSLGWVAAPVMLVSAYQAVCPLLGGVLVLAVGGGAVLHLRRELRQARWVAGVTPGGSPGSRPVGRRGHARWWRLSRL